jgi:nitroreductase
VRESDKFNARLIDAAIVADHLILAAANLGLGTCWIANFNTEAARSVLRLPAEAEPVIFTPLGYPADQLGQKIRKPLADLVRYEHW